MAFPKPFYKWRPHPWHGLDPGVQSPEVVNAYIEITPFDSVKYEVDKRMMDHDEADDKIIAVGE